MSVLAQRIIRQRGLGVAAIVGGAIFAVLYLQQVASSLASTLLMVFHSVQAGDLGQFSSVIGLYYLRTSLPFAIGIFVCLWFVAPLSSQLPMTKVVTRCLVAAGIGAVCTFLVTVVFGLIASVGLYGEIFANSFPEASFNGSSAFYGLTSGLSIGLQQFLNSAPLVILAGVFAWMWLKKHPSEHEVTSLTD